MSERYPVEIQRAIALAEHEARRLNHAYVGTEHLLLAAIQDESGLAANVLRTFGIDTNRVRHEVEKLTCAGPTAPSAAELPLTPRAKLAIEFALEEARFVNSDDWDGGFVLVGLAREPDGIAAQVFRTLGLSLQQIGGEVFKYRVLQMKIVERAVRPVRAGTARKRKMREELLAHLTGIYGEELSRLKDPRAATVEAARRFGDPGELSAELEKSVPRHERRTYYFERWVGWRAPESVARWMFRLSATLFLFLTALCTIGVSAAVLIGGRNMLLWRDVRGGTAYVVLNSVAMCTLGILFFKMRNAMFGVFGSRRSPGNALWFQTLIAMLAPACGVAYVAFTEWSLIASSEYLIPYTVAGVALSVAARVAARFNGPTEIRDTYWAYLDLDKLEFEQ